ncbi:MAG: hypothetical protein K2G41_10295 [Duncaniella sp.]|uniref:hypothetical protein n=1 Tax=Duncaniella sp. TaxID=2518496 RepID=UPI0023D14001|nr:hypothetical protein [Duncaniella sp.]MDE6091080.1 hypothetical protein [Duncaniella sp.]
MKIADYRDAANKHFQTCTYIIKNTTGKYCGDKMLLHSNVYYLSGYVVECLLKYAILQQKHASKNVSKECLEQYNLISHDLCKLFQNAIQILPDLQPKNMPDAFRNWHVEIRYESYGSHKVHLETIDSWMTNFIKPLRQSIIKKYG